LSVNYHVDSTNLTNSLKFPGVVHQSSCLLSSPRHSLSNFSSENQFIRKVSTSLEQTKRTRDPSKWRTT